MLVLHRQPLWDQVSTKSDASFVVSMATGLHDEVIIANSVSSSVPPVRPPPPPMMRPAFVPHILQRPGEVPSTPLGLLVHSSTVCLTLDQFLFTSMFTS